ncbi:hypothetical protein RUND412_001954 [Rhizina undulata]
METPFSRIPANTSSTYPIDIVTGSESSAECTNLGTAPGTMSSLQSLGAPQNLENVSSISASAQEEISSSTLGVTAQGFDNVNAAPEGDIDAAPVMCVIVRENTTMPPPKTSPFKTTSFTRSSSGVSSKSRLFLAPNSMLLKLLFPQRHLANISKVEVVPHQEFNAASYNHRQVTIPNVLLSYHEQQSMPAIQEPVQDLQTTDQNKMKPARARKPKTTTAKPKPALKLKGVPKSKAKKTPVVNLEELLDRNCSHCNLKKIFSEFGTPARFITVCSSCRSQRRVLGDKKFTADRDKEHKRRKREALASLRAQTDGYIEGLNHLYDGCYKLLEEREFFIALFIPQYGNGDPGIDPNTLTEITTKSTYERLKIIKMLKIKNNI